MTNELIKKIESINTLDLKFSAYRTGNPISYENHNCSSTYLRFSISRLEFARDKADLVFAFQILTNRIIDWFEILSKFKFYIYHLDC